MSYPTKGGTILYVEDNEDDVFFVRMSFTKLGLGHLFHSLGNGREVIDYLTGSGNGAGAGLHPLPAVLMLDLHLPLVSGMEVLDWVRHQRRFASMPVVIFSASSNPEERRKALALGASEFIGKPNSSLKFIHLAQQLVEKWHFGSAGSAGFSGQFGGSVTEEFPGLSGLAPASRTTARHPSHDPGG